MSSVKYMGEIENKFITFENFGLLPSIAQFSMKKVRKNIASQVEEEKQKRQSNYRYFHKFVAENETYLVATDHEDHEKFVINDELL